MSSTNDVDRELYTCDTCNKSYITQCNLNRHYKNTNCNIKSRRGRKPIKRDEVKTTVGKGQPITKVQATKVQATEVQKAKQSNGRSKKPVPVSNQDELNDVTEAPQPKHTEAVEDVDPLSSINPQKLELDVQNHLLEQNNDRLRIINEAIQ